MRAAISNLLNFVNLGYSKLRVNSDVEFSKNQYFFLYISIVQHFKNVTVEISD